MPAEAYVRVWRKAAAGRDILEETEGRVEVLERGVTLAEAARRAAGRRKRDIAVMVIAEYERLWVGEGRGLESSSPGDGLMGIEGKGKKRRITSKSGKSRGCFLVRCDWKLVGGFGICLGTRFTSLTQHTQEKAGGSSSRGNFSERVKLLGLNTELR